MVLALPAAVTCRSYKQLPAEEPFSGCSQLVEVGWHFVDLSVEMILDLLDEAGVLGQDEVDGSTLLTETSSSTDSVDVVLLLEWQLVVDNEANLLHIDTSGKQVSGDEHADGSLTELLHDDVSAELVHLSVHDGDGEVLIGHDLLELLNTLLGVTVDEGLVDVEVGIQVEENLNLPVVLLHGDVVLMNTFEGELLVLDQNLGGVAHEVLGQSEDLVGQGSREESDLDVAWQVFENVLDLFLETTREHLIGFVENEQFQVVGLHETTLHHVLDTAWCADDDVDAATLQNADVLFHDGSSDASVHLDALVLSNRVDDVSDLHGQLTGW